MGRGDEGAEVLCPQGVAGQVERRHLGQEGRGCHRAGQVAEVQEAHLPDRRQAEQRVGVLRDAADPTIKGDYGLGYFETLDMVSAMLGAELDSKEAFVENAVLTEDLDLGWAVFGTGTVGGQRRTYRGLRNERPVVELAICWTMSADALDPQWTDVKGFSVVIEGTPHVDATIRLGLPGQDVMTVLMDSTAVAAVNAIPFVCDAQPGVISPIDLPITGSRGALTR